VSTTPPAATPSPATPSAVALPLAASEPADVVSQTVATSVSGPQLVWFDRTGTELGIVGSPGDYRGVSLSPDGARIAVSVHAGSGEAADIWVFDAVSGEAARVTSNPADDIAPVWSADGRRIVFASSRAGTYDIYQRAVDERGTDTAVVEAAGDQIPSDSSSDGRYLAYHTDEPDIVAGGNLDLWARPLPAGHSRSCEPCMRPAT